MSFIITNSLYTRGSPKGFTLGLYSELVIMNDMCFSES